jgi:hypothetical protein
LLTAGWAPLSFAWLLLCAGCGDAGGAEPSEALGQPIVGGGEVAPIDFPAVVSLGGCSGTLVHRRLVLYAAHCGTAMSEVRFGVDAARPERTVATDFCNAYPSATLGDGSDLAYCVLAEDVRDVQPARLLAGCEEPELVPGRDVTLVGFGIAADGGEYGTARSARATIDEVGDELLIAAGGVDTCRGDSGGPVLMEVASGELRVVGVTSAGTSRRCGEGVAHYVNVARKLGWLEESAGLDVTPCFEGERWAPTSACTSVREDGSEPVPLATCGAAWRPTSDDTAPRLEVVAPVASLHHVTLASGEPYFETAVEARAEDLESGIKSVTFTLRDHLGEQLVERVDEIAPYGVKTLRLSAGSYTLDARAESFAGLAASRAVRLRVDSASAPERAGQRGCGVAQPASESTSCSFVAALLWLVALLWRMPAAESNLRVRPSGGSVCSTSPRAS